MIARLAIVAGLFGLFLGWNAPNHSPPWPAFHLEAWAALGAAALVAAALAWSPRRATVPLPRASQVLLVLGGVPILQWLGDQIDFAGDAWLGALYIGGGGLAVYAGHALAQQRGSERVLAALWTTLVLAGVAAFGLGLLHWLRVSSPGWWAMELIDDRPYANFAQPNHFGLAMVLAAVAATALFEQRQIRGRALLGLLWLMFGWGVLISESRAAVLAIAGVALYLLAVAWRVPTRLQRRDAVALLVGAMALTALFAASRASTAVGSSQEGLRGSSELGPRQAIWAHFSAAALEQPWLGHGFNQGVKAAAAVADRVEPSRNVTFAHSVVLDAAVWFGLPAALLLALLWLLWMRSLQRRSLDGGLAVQGRLVVAAWLALALQSLLEFPYAHAYFLLPLCVLAGAVGGAEAPTTPGRTARALPWIAALGFGTLLGVVLLDYLQLEAGFREARFARARFAGAPTVESLTPQRSLVLDQLAALNDSARHEPRPGISDADVESAARLARRFHILSIRLAYAKALALSGRPEEAEAQMHVVRSVLHPAEHDRYRRYWKAWHIEHAAAIDAAVTRRRGGAAP